MKRLKHNLAALERRKHFLERRLKTLGLLYTGRSYDEAEHSALTEAIKLMEEAIDKKH